MELLINLLCEPNKLSISRHKKKETQAYVTVCLTLNVDADYTNLSEFILDYTAVAQISAVYSAAILSRNFLNGFKTIIGSDRGSLEN